VEISVKGKGKPRWFFLFNDLLVKCNMSNTMKKKTFKKGMPITFEYLEQLPLEGCELVNSGDDGDKKHGFQVETLAPPPTSQCRQDVSLARNNNRSARVARCSGSAPRPKRRRRSG
jgi:hypothetical protein